MLDILSFLLLSYRPRCSNEKSLATVDWWCSQLKALVNEWGYDVNSSVGEKSYRARQLNTYTIVSTVAKASTALFGKDGSDVGLLYVGCMLLRLCPMKARGCYLNRQADLWISL